MQDIPSVGVKAGILNTIAKSIYSDKRIKTREAVSNSIDNDASAFLITIDESTRTISFLDNGHGISKSRFKEIFSSIGYGQTREDDHTNSYFGLGLMSILQLGKKARILTRCVTDESISENNLFDISTASIFNELTENEPVGSITQHIQFGDLQSNREELSPVSDTQLSNIGIDTDTHFTEILLEDVEASIIDEFGSGTFKTELQKILPLVPDFEHDRFFSRINSVESLNRLKKIMSNEIYCKTIDVYYGKKGYEEGYTRLYKYYPDFREEISFSEDDIRFLYSKDGRFISYFVVSSQNIEKDDDNTPEETGFWVRNRNILVKSSDFFQRPGTRKKIVDEPLKTWVFGEVFHKDMTKMLVVTRDEYLWDNQEFQQFLTELRSFVEKVNREYREIWQRGKKVVELVIEPFKTIQSKVFKNFGEVILQAGIIGGTSEIDGYGKKFIHEFSDPSIEEDINTVEHQISQSQTDLVLVDDYDGDIRICVAKKPLASGQSYMKQRDSVTKKLVIKISPSIFATFRTTFLGQSYQVVYVLNKESNSSISINEDKGIIYINLIGVDVAKFNVTFVDYLLVTKAAYLASSNKQEMYNILVELIGRKHAFGRGGGSEPGDLFKTMEAIFSRR